MNNKVIVVVEGGCVQSVLSNSEVDVLILDYDTDGLDEIFMVEQGEKNHPEPARLYQVYPETDENRIAELFQLYQEKG